MSGIAIFLLKIYQSVSRVFPKRCVYFPTCSEYAVQAFKKHFFLKALFLTTLRILRCNPFSHGGFDPVR
ncbi:MAG: membrane protein insertion efficiency factor YidD [Candidatus Omnitrophica bacterium]|nr:membrane protein insertion efficiency factor YidD [Candidatus Omnitrophota bacterium]